MYIRSQNKEHLFNMSIVGIVSYLKHSELNNHAELRKTHHYVRVQFMEYHDYAGEYSTKEKVMKVIDMIACEIVKCQPEFIFQMPQDNEVV